MKKLQKNQLKSIYAGTIFRVNIYRDEARIVRQEISL